MKGRGRGGRGGGGRGGGGSEVPLKVAAQEMASALANMAITSPHKQVRARASFSPASL